MMAQVRLAKRMPVRGGTVLLLAVAAAALILTAPAAASERHPTLAELEREVMCPTCRQLLELSQGPLADRERAFIRARIAAGDTKSELKRRLVAQFGEGILAAPPARGFNLLAWLLPFVGLFGTGAVIGVLAWRWVRAPTPASAPPEALEPDESLDPALERRLDEELALFDG